jgi:phenylalanyl-tRNA synthetase beta chain
VKFSQQWIQQYVNIQDKYNLEQIVHLLTMAGLEVDSVEAAAALFSGVVVGQVIETKKHPNAEKLTICQVCVDNTGKHIELVCGANNVSPNIKVAVAMLGAHLSEIHKDGEVLKSATLKGVVSPGMLLSEKELGLSSSTVAQTDGIMILPQDAPVGDSVWDYLALEDHVIDIDLTPNRGDCLSAIGVARELSVLTELPLIIPDIKTVPASSEAKINIVIQAKAQCPRYVGRVIKNLNTDNISTPIWMQERLRRGDIRCIHPVVDVLNYVMLELGQPMHAFDLAKIEGGITVRLAKRDEPIVLLDEQEVKLKENTLVIADDKKALAIAGVMGGLDSAVTESTQDILLESALFSEVHQAGKARLYGLHTDSAFRYERGVDPELQARAIERATGLILEICGGEAGEVIDITTDSLETKQAITLRYQRITQILGITFEPEQVKALLGRIGCKALSVQSSELSICIQPPSYRYDINLEIDLIEELARVYGYENVPTELPKVPFLVPNCQEDTISTIRIKQAMVDMGYNEAITYSFVDSDWQNILFPEEKTLELLNPISQDMDTMRYSLLPGLLKTVSFNQRRQQYRMMVFEVGNCFAYQNGELQQEAQISGVCYGERLPETWRATNAKVDFYDVKSHINRLWQLTLKQPLRYVMDDVDINQKGQSASIYCGEQKVGLIGKLNPEKQKQLDIDGALYWFTCDLAPFKQKNIPVLQRPSKFPEIRRDIAVIVDQSVLSGSLTTFVGELAEKWLVKINIFDEYKGKGITPGRKSIAMGLILQHPSRTLIDSEVSDLMDGIVAGLAKDFGAELRD